MSDHQDPQLPPHDDDFDDTRRVFAVPVSYIVSAEIYILAHDIVEARKTARDLNLNDNIVIEPEHFYVDATDRVKLLDVIPAVIDLVTVHPVNVTDYDPTDHPDWCPVPTA
jgi:hypothetical protein